MRCGMWVARCFVVMFLSVAAALAADMAVGNPGWAVRDDAITHTLLVAAVVFVAILLLGLAARAAGERAGRKRAAQAAQEGAPQVTRAVGGTVLRSHVPTNPLLEPLPGRLEVVHGDAGLQEIRFFPAHGQSYPEVTFGRMAGFPLCHVQIEASEVAGRQAKLSYLEGRWVLGNLARSPASPTRHRGAPMGFDEQVVLLDGDEIELGPVALVFRA